MTYTENDLARARRAGDAFGQEVEPESAAALRDEMRAEIRHLRTALEASDAKIMAVMQHIPMAYLRRHDQPGATGPTKALNLEAAMRDYAADRLKAIDRIRQLSAALEASEAALATARREGAEVMREALAAAAHHTKGLWADDILSYPLPDAASREN